MEPFDKVFTEEQVVGASDKILQASVKTIGDWLNETFYSEMESFLYEHYQNVKGRIENELLADLAGKYLSDPSHPKFAELRKKLFEENKDVVVKSLTDDVIQRSVENTLENLIDSSANPFAWRWKDKILDFIILNWEKLIRDGRIDSGLLRTIDQKDQCIKALRKTIGDYQASPHMIPLEGEE